MQRSNCLTSMIRKHCERRHYWRYGIIAFICITVIASWPLFWDRSNAISQAQESASSARYKSVVPAIPGSGDPNNLVLQIVPEGGTHLLGVPLPVQCSIINETNKEFAVPYQYGIGYAINEIILKVIDEDGMRAVPINRSVYDGPILAIHIPAGHRFVQTIDLNFQYAIVAAGKYSVGATFASNGKFHDGDDWNNLVERIGWQGELEAATTEVVISGPSTDEDLMALKLLQEGMQQYKVKQRNSMLFSAMNREAMEKLIRQIPKSRYTAYARTYLAEWELGQEYWKNEIFARRGLEHLEALRDTTWSEYPKSLHERSLYWSILAHMGIGADKNIIAPLVKEFRDKFPDSSLQLPAEILEAIPLSKQRSSK